MNKQIRDTDTPLRALVAKRLSNLTDSTTHLATETETIEDFCRRKNIEIRFAAEDLDISGGKPIRDRPGVGQYLTDEYLSEWDVLILYRLDRGFRNHLDFVNFYHEYCDGHGKQIISVGEDIDMSTKMGKFIAGILVQFAEWELERMGERRAAASVVIRREARWGGGSFPFGYEPFKDGANWYLRPHGVYAEETRRMAAAIIAGKSLGSVADDLNERGIPTARDAQLKIQGKEPKGRKWQTSSVRDHLTSDVIRGYVVHYKDGSHKPPVRVTDSSGEYVRREPLIQDGMWYDLKRALDASAKPQSGIRSRGSALLQVAFCGYCGAPLYTNKARRRDGTQYAYYMCRHTRTTCTPSKSIQHEVLEDIVSDALLEAVGDCEYTRKTVVKGDDHSQALAKLGMQIADLTTQHYVHGGVADFESRMAALQSEHARVSVLEKDDDTTEEIGTGETFSARWNAMDTDGRHSFLIGAGVKVEVERAGDDSPRVIVQADDEWRKVVESRGGRLATDERGRVLTVVRDGWRVTIHLGDLARLRERASQ